MIMTFILYISALTIPIWGIVFCLTLIRIIEKIHLEEDHPLETFWFTVSFVVMITVITYILGSL